MKPHFLLLILLSAFLHAFYNFLMRGQEGRRRFLIAMFAAASVPAVLLPLFRGSLAGLPWRYAPIAFGASFFYMLYQFLVCKAYETGTISRMYPLTVLSPALIPFWAARLLGERLTLLHGGGILLTLAGAVMVKLDAITGAEIKKMFSWGREYRGARFALAASVVYSFGAVMDKACIRHFPLDAYMAVLILSMTLNGLLFLRFPRPEKSPFSLKNHWKTVVLGGFTVFCSFLSFRAALGFVPVSIAVPARQASVIFAILLGTGFLGEKLKPLAVAGSFLIMAGVALISW